VGIVSTSQPEVDRGRALGEVFAAFLRLGVSAFGGPVAHIGYFNAEFVERRAWLDQESFAQVVALCQFLPGPASSQVCIVIGLIRAGALGGALAWVAFTLPSAILLTIFALGVAGIPGIAQAPWLHGLLTAAVAVVAVAVSGMYRSLCPDVPRKSLALLSAVVITLLPATGFAQLAVIVAGALYGRFFISATPAPTRPFPAVGNGYTAIGAGAVFLALLFGLPVVDRFAAGTVHVVTAFYESGALVFGGGHVILPLLQARVVPPGWIGQDTFLAGYGAAQAVPGPLFTFAAYLGAAMHGPVSGVSGAAIALVSVYLPSFLLIAAILPYWNGLLRNASVAAAIQGVNAAVVGVLLAAFYQPVWVSAIRAPADAAFALLAFVVLAVWKWPPWLVVVSSAVAMQLTSVLFALNK
jgi:chromate transporter